MKNIIKKLFTIVIFYYILKYKNKTSLFLNSFNKYFRNHEFKIKSFNIISINYSFSFRFNILKVEYNFSFYDNRNNLIMPSDLTLYNDFHILCHINENNNKSIIDSLANIYLNKYYSCIEFINLKEKVKFGIKIFKNKKFHIFYIFEDKLINYNNLNYNEDYKFDPIIHNDKYTNLKKKIRNFGDTNKELRLKNSYIQKPFYSNKNKAIINYNKWNYINIYNHYFCACKGQKCKYNKIPQKCKYYFYLNIIDNNKNIYKKTDYLLVDFMNWNSSSDDAFPIFKEMIKLNMPAHYMTTRLDIYKQYCNNKKICLTIILINKKNKLIDGDFLESYLTLILKLKATIAGSMFKFIDNIFYNIDYITSICVGHGVSLFKDFLYYNNSYYGYLRYDKILIPPNNKLIYAAIKNGWNINNIIKLNLPRWDKYTKNYSSKNNIIDKNSLYVLFTWRHLKYNKRISKYYLQNIDNLLKNEKLNKVLKKNKITLYFSLHHKLRYLQKKYIFQKYFNYIVEEKISDCISNSNLLITDFSSVIFDFICRKKPFIMFVPDANDPNIKTIYSYKYYKTIILIKKNSFNFVNIFFNINETVNKIIYYINNNFKLEKKLKIFYKSFGFKSGKNIKDFIKYLKNLK